MGEKDSKTLEHISETLDAVLAEIKKPRHIVLRILDIAAAGIGVLGILAVIDLIIQWVTGESNIMMQLIIGIALILLSIALFCISSYLRKVR